ncbi:hypothetical protein B0A49_00771 [Cryomyces minteri]|uniref:Signal peptidase complex subunit 1 n=1 Tax=Cryomyces minteri TaxID=331657 RepID=A0A4U0XJC8_9PEZI|nr:hypothetical protein B0A49_00771 [Cryomyces minteri]
MADALLEKVREILEGHIDFEGQRTAELMTTAFLATVGVFAFLAGYIAQNIHYTLYLGLAGTALTFLAIVPPWPFFNRNPVAWLPAQNGLGAIGIEVDGKKVS